MTNDELFQRLFGFPAADLWSMTAERFVEWTNEQAKAPNVTISDEELEDAGFEL